MNKKYFDTKKGSIEEKINTIATKQTSISKPQSDIKLSVEKKYFETKSGSLEDLASKLVSESFIKKTLMLLITILNYICHQLHKEVMVTLLKSTRAQ